MLRGENLYESFLISFTSRAKNKIVYMVNDTSSSIDCFYPFLLKAERLELCLVSREPWAKELRHLQWTMNINKAEEQP